MYMLKELKGVINSKRKMKLKELLKKGVNDKGYFLVIYPIIK